jgi:hypothetical protein
MKGEKNLDFEINEKYNIEKLFTVKINFTKTCFFKDENVKGTVTIKAKDTIKKSILNCTIAANASLLEVHNYKVKEGGNDTTEELLLFKCPVNIPQFTTNNILDGVTVPFEFQISHSAYPSCIFGMDSYIRHILIFDFPTIETKKSTIIIIKNRRHFTEFNQLYKTPAVIRYKTCKHKWAIFHKGEFICTLKLLKNAFGYNENIPLVIDIDCSKLKIRLNKIYISLMLSVSKNSTTNHKQSVSKFNKKVTSKSFCFAKKQDNYHSEVVMKLPKGNPYEIYKQLDADNRCYGEKFKDVLLFPSCYEGLLTCEYYFKIVLETNTLFSTDEEFILPIDFYATENEKEKKEDEKMNFDKLRNLSEGNFITPMGINQGNNIRSLSLTNNEVKKDNNEDNNIINIPLSKTLNPETQNYINLFGNNELNIDKGGDNEEYDAPPSINQNLLEIKDK